MYKDQGWQGLGRTVVHIPCILEKKDLGCSVGDV